MGIWWPRWALSFQKVHTTWRATAIVCSSSTAYSGPRESMEGIKHIAIISLPTNLRKVRSSRLAQVMRKSQHKILRQLTELTLEFTNSLSLVHSTTPPALYFISWKLAYLHLSLGFPLDSGLITKFFLSVSSFILQWNMINYNLWQNMLKAMPLVSQKAPGWCPRVVENTTIKWPFSKSFFLDFMFKVHWNNMNAITYPQFYRCLVAKVKGDCLVFIKKAIPPKKHHAQKKSLHSVDWYFIFLSSYSCFQERHYLVNDSSSLLETELGHWYCLSEPWLECGIQPDEKKQQYRSVSRLSFFICEMEGLAYP